MPHHHHSPWGEIAKVIQNSLFPDPTPRINAALTGAQINELYLKNAGSHDALQARRALSDQYRTSGVTQDSLGDIIGMMALNPDASQHEANLRLAGTLAGASGSMSGNPLTELQTGGGLTRENTRYGHEARLANDRARSAIAAQAGMDTAALNRLKYGDEQVAMVGPNGEIQLTTRANMPADAGQTHLLMNPTAPGFADRLQSQFPFTGAPAAPTDMAFGDPGAPKPPPASNLGFLFGELAGDSPAAPRPQSVGPGDVLVDANGTLLYENTNPRGTGGQSSLELTRFLDNMENVTNLEGAGWDPEIISSVRLYAAEQRAAGFDDAAIFRSIVDGLKRGGNWWWSDPDSFTPQAIGQPDGDSYFSPNVNGQFSSNTLF